MRHEAAPAGTNGGNTPNTNHDTDSTVRITYVCDECHRPVQDGDGYVHLQYPPAQADAGEGEATEGEATEGGGFPMVTAATMMEQSKRPKPPPTTTVPTRHWETHHRRRCDPDPYGDDYWIAVERVRTLVDLANRTKHLSEKRWFPTTDWPDLVVRALWSVPWTFGGSH
ncbi:hypothetical protein [Rhodococcus sp. LB1]|uniref:hypothetical protein n=1 Tax=Rhodococcus sp. LB1 TaxID=1807499 RepID=UPI000A5A0110|nr:hypothetical protein [Rhodococcus sp. LB1]